MTHNATEDLGISLLSISLLLLVPRMRAVGPKEREIFPQDSFGSRNSSEILKENYVRVDCQVGRGFFSKFKYKVYPF